MSEMDRKTDTGHSIQ